jgi:hypothetical protein
MTWDKHKQCFHRTNFTLLSVFVGALTVIRLHLGLLVHSTVSLHFPLCKCCVCHISHVCEYTYVYTYVFHSAIADTTHRTLMNIFIWMTGLILEMKNTDISLPYSLLSSTTSVHILVHMYTKHFLNCAPFWQGNAIQQYKDAAR